MHLIGRKVAARARIDSSLGDEVPSTSLRRLSAVSLRSGTALATLGAAAVVLFAASPVCAQQYWDGNNGVLGQIEGGAGTWDGSGANWTDVSGLLNQPWLGGVAIFGGGSGGGVSVSGAQNFDTMQFLANGYRLTGSPLNLVPTSGTAATISVDSGVTTEIGSVLQGGGGLDVEGGGTLNLTGMNTYTGATTIASGSTLALYGQGRINGSSGVTVDGRFDISHTDAGASIKALAGSGVVVLGDGSDGKPLSITAASGTFSGVISGGGGINIAGATQVFTGENTFTGSTGISQGATLQIGDGGTSGSIVGNVNNWGTLAFNRSDELTYAGVVTGPGAFSFEGGGKLILTGTSSGGSTTTIAAGSTLQLGNGGASGWIGGGTVNSGTITNNGDLIYNRSDNVRWRGKFAGAGDIYQEGSGALTLSGDSSAFSGSMTVKSGSLIVGLNGVGALGGTVDVKSGARLGGSGTIGGNVTVAAGATHGVGDAVASQTINGNYANHGVLEIRATPFGADKLVVNGTVDITGAKLNLLLSPPTNTSWDPTSGPFTVIENDGIDAVVGSFASVGNLNNLLFLDHSINYAGGAGGNDVTLTLTRNDLSLGAVAHTPNQSAVSGALESLPVNNPVRSALLMSTDEDQARDALGQLSGDVHASVSGGVTQASTFLSQFANDRVRSSFGDVAAPSLPLMAYGDDGIDLVAVDSDRFVVWGQALGNWGTVDGNDNVGGFDYSSGGLVAGGDTLVGDGWRLGLLAGYSRTSFDTDDRASSGNSDNIHVGLYGGRHWGAVGLRAGAAYTRHLIETSRVVSFPGLNETLEADYDAGTAQAFVEAGYQIGVGSVDFEPFAGLAYVRTSSDAFTETGGAAALSNAANSFDSTTTTLGLRAAADFTVADLAATARGGLGWRHAFGDVSPTSLVAFAGGDSFVVYGTPIARDALLVEAGLDLAMSPKAGLSFSYFGQVASSARDHGVKANLAVKF